MTTERGIQSKDRIGGLYRTQTIQKYQDFGMHGKSTSPKLGCDEAAQGLQHARNFRLFILNS